MRLCFSAFSGGRTLDLIDNVFYNEQSFHTLQGSGRCVIKKLDLPPSRIIEKLSGLQIFSNLSETETKELFESCDFYEYDDGEKIIKQDETSTFLCGILEGDVTIRTSGEGGRDIRLGRVHQGDIVGEASLFVDVSRTADVVADGRVEIVLVSRDKLMGFVNASAKAGVKIFGFLIFSLIRKLKGINQELVFEKESTVSAQDLERLKAYFTPADGPVP